MSDTRIIDGRSIQRTEGAGWIRWRCVVQPPPIETQSFDRQTGRVVTIVRNLDPIVHLDVRLHPERELAERFRRFEYFGAAPWAEFDPREHDELWNELERAKAAGFENLVLMATHNLKVKPRRPIGGFDLGTCYTHRETACLDGRIDRGELFRRHAHSERAWLEEAGAISADQRWFPLGFSQAVQNVIALDTGFGVLRSEYFFAGDPTRRNPNPNIRDAGSDIRVSIDTYLLPSGRPRQTLLSARFS